MRLLLLPMLFCVLWGEERPIDLQTLVTRALERSDAIAAIRHRLEAADARIRRSTHIEDPDLSFMIGDVRLDRPLERSLEPMQFGALNLMQRFPAPGKRTARKRKEEAHKRLLFGSLEEARAMLAERVRSAAATLWQTRRTARILRRYLKILDRAVALNAAYSESDAAHHMATVSASLLRSRIRIRLERILAKREQTAAYLAYLVDRKIDRVRLPKRMRPPEPKSAYLAKIENNPRYRIASSRLRLKKEETTLAHLGSRIDPYLKAGYYYRKGFPDYMSVTVGAKIPIYGTQKLSAEIAAKEALSASLKRNDLKRKIESEILATHARINEAYRTYRLLHRRELPQLRHLLDLSRAHLKSGGDLVAYLDLLTRQLLLEERIIAARADYLRAKAHMNNLTGVVQ